MDRVVPRFIFAGRLSRDYILMPSCEARLDAPGGNILYAAAGLAVWEPDPRPGIVARVGEDYPREWLDQFERWGIDTRGVRILPEAVDVRRFCAYLDLSSPTFDDPVAHFARCQLPFPKALLGYRNPSSRLDSRTQLSSISLRQADFPPDFLDGSAAHRCPLDLLTHQVVPAVLRQAEITTVTLDPSPGYMNPIYFDDIPALLSGLTAFLPSEEDLCNLFQGRSNNLWEMAEALTEYGCEIIVIKRGENGQYLYDASTRSCWEIPPYPARMVDPTGVGDALCGGFLAGYRRTYDPLEAVLHGNISASLVMEGSGPNYALDALPGLAEARLEALRQSARKR
jgi:sugar/nucleoside kinase (ribokinase family)